MTPDEKLLIPAEQASQMLSMGRSTFWRCVKNGEAPQPVRIGGITRWRVADLQRYVADLASSPTTTSASGAG